MIETLKLENGFPMAILWQNAEEIPEPALFIRAYDEGLIVITQSDREINLNVESLPELIKALKHCADYKPKKS